MEQFGELLGANKSSVSGWERGTVVPSSQRLKKIAELGKISLAELLTPYRGIEEIHISILEKKLFRDFPSILNDYTEEEIELEEAFQSGGVHKEIPVPKMSFEERMEALIRAQTQQD